MLDVTHPSLLGYLLFENIGTGWVHTLSGHYNAISSPVTSLIATVLASDCPALIGIVIPTASR